MSRALLLGVALLLGACSSTPEEPEDVEVKLPSQNEADSQARNRIDRANADDEFSKLQAEIDAEGKP
jgi:hypothetical protein